MVQMSQNGSPGNQPRGNKRPFSNAGFNNQTDYPRGGGGGAKFQRKSYGGAPHHGNFNNSNGNFNNRNGGRNNQNNFKGNFKNSGKQFNRSWEQNRNKGTWQQNKSASFVDDSTKSPGKRNQFEDQQELNDTIDNQVDNNLETSTQSALKQKKDLKKETSAQSALKQKKDLKKETSSESEEEIETNADSTSKVEPEMDLEASDSSEEEDEDDEVTEEIEKQAEEEEIDHEAIVSSEEEIECTEAEEQDININTGSKTNENVKNKLANIITVRGLNGTIREECLKEFFAKYGEVQNVRKVDTSLSSKAIIHFKNADSVQKALEVNGMSFKDQLFKVSPGVENPIIAENSIFLKNLPIDITVKEVWEAVELHLPVSYILFQLPKSNFRNATVVFESADYKQLALQLNTITIKGGKATVSDYKPRIYAQMSRPWQKPGFRPMQFSNGPLGRQMHYRGTFQPRPNFHTGNYVGGPYNSRR